MMRDITISATDLTKVYGTGTPLIARLLDNTTPVTGKSLIFNINGVNYTRVTDADGKAVLNINLLPGTYPTTIKFNGDATYNQTIKSVVVRVVSNATPQKTVKGNDNYFEVNQIPLHVIMNDGFSTTMGTEVKETDLLMQSSSMNAPTFYFNQGDHGVEFDISIVIKQSYYFNTQPVADYLNAWNKTNTPVSVVTDAIDVPNSKYVMRIKSKKQTSKSLSIWKLHFKQFYENNLSFETMYSSKTTSLSSQDQVLVKYQIINEKSPKEAILALQQKLQMKACWSDTVYKWTGSKWQAVVVETSDGPQLKSRIPNGVWDSQMTDDIYSFQIMNGLGGKKQGVCDRETINALLGSTYEGQGYYDQWHG